MKAKNFFLTKNKKISNIKAFLFLNCLENPLKYLIIKSKTSYLLLLVYYLKNLMKKILKNSEILYIEKEFEQSLSLKFQNRIHILIKLLLFANKKRIINKKLILKLTLNFLLQNLKTIKKFDLKNVIKKIFLLFLKNSPSYKEKNCFSFLKDFTKTQIRNEEQIRFNQILYFKLIGILTKCGKKTKAIKILDIALNKVCREISIPIDEILNQIVDALKVSVEPRKIKIRRNLHIVPFPINEKRKAFLIAKWLVSKTKKASQSASDKIASEILKILKGEKSESESNREYYVNKSLDNISNIHFRW